MPAKKHARTESHGEEDPALKHPSTKRAKEIDADPPFGTLTELLEKSTTDSKPKNVLHWFRSKDIRAEDNKGLHAASKKAKEGDGSLITVYLHSPKDLDWHGTSPARTDFLLESLRILKKQLEEKNIPLAIITAEERNEKTNKVLHFIKEHDITHVFCNMEYEVDELRRDIAVVKHLQKESEPVSIEILHDQTVMVPSALKTGSGGAQKVFTPYHKQWVAELASDPSLFDTVPEPDSNDASAKKTFKSLFSHPTPTLPETKSFDSDTTRDRIRRLWPAGHAAGIERLSTFLKDKVSDYAAHRSEPAANVASRLSAYFSAGIISVREALQAARKANDGAAFDSSGDPGIASWVRELVFREFYRHTMVGLPHDGMNLPHNLKFDFVHWEEDEEGWKKWCEGKTGMPFVDAGMRQLNTEAYMHNRCRMNTSSYLRANLLIDYRRGERYFAEHLIDWDLCNNTQGWEPSYTIFNPVIQAEKCDPNGDFIRKWVPELKDVKGKAVFAPHERLSKEEFEKLGYPAPHVDFRETQQRAKERYKADLAEADP